MSCYENHQIRYCIKVERKQTKYVYAYGKSLKDAKKSIEKYGIDKLYDGKFDTDVKMTATSERSNPGKKFVRVLNEED